MFQVVKFILGIDQDQAGGLGTIHGCGLQIKNLFDCGLDEPKKEEFTVENVKNVQLQKLPIKIRNNVCYHISLFHCK